MKYGKLIVGATFIFASFASGASDGAASPLAEKQLWNFSERIALALPGDGRDVSAIVSGTARPDSASSSGGRQVSVTEIGPSLSAKNAVVVMGKQGIADSVSFDLEGSCVPLKSLRSRYPSLLVLDQARGESVHAQYTFGTQVGDAIIAYSFPADQLGCMNHVDVSPAAPIKAKMRSR